MLALLFVRLIGAFTAIIGCVAYEENVVWVSIIMWALTLICLFIDICTKES